MTDEGSFVPRPRRSVRGYFAPRRERFLCLRRPHFFQQRKKWGKERRQKLRFCTSSARYTCLLPSSFFLTRPAFSYPLSVSRLCQHSFPLPLPVTTVKLFVLPCRRLRNNYTPCPTGTPTFAAARRKRRDLIIANPVEANTPTVAGQAVAEASAPVNAGTVLLTDSDDRCTPPASTHRQICTCPPRAKGSLDRRSKRCFWLLLSPQTKVARAGARNYPRRRQRKRSRRGAK